MKKRVGRPPKDKRKIPVSLKLDSDLLSEIEDLAAVNYSDKTKMIERCLRIGIPIFIKEDRLDDKLEEYRSFHTQKKRSHG